MRRLFLKLILAALVVIGGTITASATQTTITAQTVGPVFSPQLQSGSPVVTMRVYASLPFLSNDTPPVAIPSGTPQGGGQAIAPVTCTYNSTTGLISIPSFVLYNTTDALGPPNGIQATYSFYIYVNGSLLNPNPLGFLNRIGVPPIIAPHMACSPANHCADFVDLLNYNQGTPLPSIPTATYSQGVIDQKIQAAISNGGAPAGETFFVATPDVAHIPQAIPFSALGTGLVKNTTITGIPTIAVPGVDFQAPISAVTPLTFAGNAVGLAGLTTLGTSNQLVGMNNAASGYEYKTFSLGGAGSSPAVAFAPNSITLNVPTASGSNTGFLASADWTTFNNKQAALSFPLTGTQGGTGVNNGSFLFTMGGNVTFAGAFNTTITVTGGTGVTLPITGTLLANSRQIINGTGITGGGDLSADRTLSVVADTVTERIDVQQGGSVVGTRKAVNFIQGSNTTLTVTDNPGSNRVDVTVAASGVLGVSWSGLTNPSTGLSLSMGTNATSFLWVSGTTGPEWSLQHAALSGSPNVVQSAEFDTSGNTNTGPMRRINTVSGSTVAIPFQVCAQGVVNCTHVDTGGIWRADGSGGFDATALVAGTVPLARISALTGTQFSTAATLQVAGLGIGVAPNSFGLVNAGGTLNSQGTGTVGSAEFDVLYNPTTSTSAVNWPALLIKPTFNASGSSAGRTVDFLRFDSVDTGTTGFSSATRNFVRGTINGGSTLWLVDTAGNETLAGNVSAVNGTFSGPVTVSTLNGLTVSTSTGTLTVTNAKTVSFANSIAFAAGADGQTFTFPSATDTIVARTSTDALTNKSLGSGTAVTASISFTAGVKQTFAPNATNAGINVGSVSADPASPANGDLWYNSTGNALNARINGATVALGSGGGGSGTIGAGVLGNVPYYTGTGTTVGPMSGFAWNNTNQTEIHTGAAVATGWTPLLTLTPGAITAVTNEVNSVLHSAQTVSIHTGFANQRFVWIRQPVIQQDTNGLTVTNTATFTIEGAPSPSAGGAAGTAPTLTAPWALWIPSGKNLAGNDWLTGFRIATTLSTQVNGISPTSQIGVTGASRQSDIGGNAGSVIGVSGWAWNDTTNATGQGAWGGYFESHMGNNSNISPANGANAIGVEIDSVNQVSPFNASRATSYSVIPNQMSTALWLASGGGGGQAPTTYTNSVRSHLAIGIINNTQTFDKGIVFQNKALARVGDLAGGTGTGLATAIEFATGQQLIWMNPSSVAIANLSDQGMLLPYNTQLLMTNQAGSLNIPAIQLATVNSQNNVLLLGAAASVTTITNPISNMWVGSTSVLNSLNTTTFFGFQASDGIGGAVVSAGVGAAPAFRTLRTDGNSAGFTTIQNGDVIGSFQNAAYDGTAFKISSLIQAVATENFVNGTNTGTQMKFFTTLTGTNATFNAMTITGNGNVVLTGTNTNDSASAGQVGEFVNSLVATGSAVSLTTNVAANVTSISLTAGDWDVTGSVDFNLGAATTAATAPGQVGISTTTATLPSDGSEVMVYETALTTTTTKAGMSLPRKRISVSGTTTVFLVALYQFSAGTTTAYGTISARRIR